MKRMNLLGLIAAACLALALSGIAALATEATSNTWLNVRAGPGTSHAVVGTLATGESVTVEECAANNWCRITRAGPSGWVNASYLTPVPPADASGPDCRFELTFGPGGPSLAIVCGSPGTPPPPPPPPPPVAQACFYTGPNYSGAEFCRGLGTSNTLGGGFNDAISSVRLYGAAQAQLCEDTHLAGYCRIVNTDTPVLGPLINNRASSLRVFTGAPPPPPPPPLAQACFYTGPNYSGAEFCRGLGTSNTLGGGFNDAISSVRLHGAAQAQLCDGTHLSGYCRIVNADTPVLGPLINNRASSLRVFTGAPPPPPPPPPPVVHSTGSLSISPLQTANLDNGGVNVAGADIQYMGFLPLPRFLEARGGALLARGDGSNRGFAGCSAESFSATPIPFTQLAVGTYVCVRTSEGRISQFRVNGFTGPAMNLGYTTWAP